MTGWVSEMISSLGYLGIALLAFLENIFPPIPSELIMPMAGFVAAKGEISLTGAIAGGSIGSLIGCLGWYYIGKAIGERRLRSWVGRHGHWLTLSEEDIDKAHDHFRRHGASVVFFGRLVPGIRSWISVPAGLNGMGATKFTLYSAAGTLLWTALLTVGGYLLQSNFAEIGKYLSPISTAVFILLAVWYLWRVVQQMRRRAAD